MKSRIWWIAAALVLFAVAPSLAEPGVPGVPPELGGPGFTGEGWETGTEVPSGSPQAVKGGHIRFHMAEFPATLRRYGKDSNSVFLSAVSSLLYEGLLNLDDTTLEIVPELATHWKISEDKMTFSFRINPEARWADGAPVTADDVIATWRLLTDEGILMPYTNALYGKFEEPVAESPYLLHVTTTEENWRHFLYFAISIRVMPAHHIGGMTGAEYLDTFQFTSVPGTGPYELLPENIVNGVSLTLTRRDDWWGKDDPANAGIYNFDEIEWVVVLDERLALEKFKKGELDVYSVNRASWWVNEFNYDEIQRGVQLKRKIYNEEVQGLSGLAMNTRKPPFDDIRVRKAIAHLYDRDTLIEKLFYGEYLKLKSYFPGGMYENPDNEYYEYDPEKAVALLAEAGWKERNSDGWLVNDKGEIFELTLTFDQPSWERIHTVLQEELVKVGIKLNLKQMTSATQFSNTMEHNFTITFQSWGGLFWPNPNSSLHSGNADPQNTTNITGMKNARIDSLALLYDEEYDQQRRVELIREIDAICMEECHYALAWYAPFSRIAFWNKYGYPDGYLGRVGDYLAVMQYWYEDPARKAAMERAIADPSIKLPTGEVVDKYWLKKLGKI
ncbi:MAG: ABC transporter substrate-binding protein [Candidatus Krumholzibacteriota bacterium]|nr:ABC transporter substrate-binding protein [Candidatus Krumholzibacteriota bacterium]